MLNVESWGLTMVGHLPIYSNDPALMKVGNEFGDGGYIGSVVGEHRQFGNIGAISRGEGPYHCRFSGSLRVLHTAAHVAQLNPEQRNLTNRTAEQQQSEPSKPNRIVRDPLRFESKLFV